MPRLFVLSVIAAFGTVVACRTAPGPSGDVLGDRERAQSVKADLLDRCKEGEESACLRIGVRPKDEGEGHGDASNQALPSSQGPKISLAEWEAATTPNSAADPAVEVTGSGAAAIPGPVAPWLCFEGAFQGGNRFGGCAVSLERCQEDRAFAKKNKVRVEGPCFELPKAACFTLSEPLRNTRAFICAPSFESCILTQELHATSVEFEDVSECDAHDVRTLAAQLKSRGTD